MPTTQTTSSEQQTPTKPDTHVITYNGEMVTCNADNMQDVCDALIAKHGPGVPVPVAMQAPINDDAPTVRPLADVPAVNNIEGGKMDHVGRLRSETDLAAARAAGFAPQQTVYERGTRVIDVGVDAARRSRLEHLAKPTVHEYCTDFVAKIAGEQRRDRVVTLGALSMLNTGALAVTNGTQHVVQLQDRAFRQLLSRTDIRGGEYLSRCWPELRAKNVNDWLRSGKLDPEKTVKLRVRNARDTGREVFGVVSEQYTDMDVDRVAMALAKAAPADARGSVVYDGYRAKFEVEFHSDVQPEEYVAGEFFKVAALVRTDDTGSGSLIVQLAMTQNLCLNLIIIDNQAIQAARIKHVGDDLEGQFEEAFKCALDNLGHFQKAWGYALNDELVATQENEQMLKDLFNGVVERELVPVRGKRDEVLNDLVRMYRADDSAAVQGRQGVTRAAVVNAFTRYAHEVNQDPWQEDEIQKAAGALLFGNKLGAKPVAIEPLALEA